MFCWHCKKKLEYGDSHIVVYDGNVYCDEECMLYDIDYGTVDFKSFTKGSWDKYSDWDDEVNNALETPR